MNYEKAWKSLKSHIEVLEGALIRFTEEGLIETTCAVMTTKAILCRMEMIEKEMTTVLDDDGQKVQD